MENDNEYCIAIYTGSLWPSATSVQYLRVVARI